MIGVPPAAGFLSKWYILMGAFQAENTIAVVVIVLSTLLNAGYFLPIIYAAFFKEADEPIESGEAPFRSLSPWSRRLCSLCCCSFSHPRR